MVVYNFTNNIILDSQLSNDTPHNYGRTFKRKCNRQVSRTLRAELKRLAGITFRIALSSINTNICIVGLFKNYS